MTATTSETFAATVDQDQAQTLRNTLVYLASVAAITFVLVGAAVLVCTPSLWGAVATVIS